MFNARQDQANCRRLGQRDDGLEQEAADCAGKRT
jgi:hypothetical protein